MLRTGRRTQASVWLTPLALMALAVAAPALAEPPLVLVTTPDVATIVQAVAGDLVEIQVVLPPGADPHDFTITSEQIRGFGRGSLIVFAASRYHEFEAAIKSALPRTPALDWDDYAAAGASLRDYPGYQRNPHAPWLRMDNALAIACVVAYQLEAMGLPGPVLQRRLDQFRQDVAAQQALARRVAETHGLTRRPMLAVIPGVCDVIANFGVPVGDVLMAEGSGTVAGKRLQEAVAKLRSGEYAALVCPLSMRQAKQGEAARQVAADSGAPIIYVHFLDSVLGQDTYVSQMAENAAAFAAVGGAAPGAAAAPVPARTRQPLALALVGVIGVLLGVLLGRLFRRRAQPRCGAGIFDE